ncbi:hypothetical protein ABFS82_09G038200 [Erythranthe guttata]|uniref:isoflavone 2'-hydroxylase-like n=1 Tax=Erythranthe guttata TaxID=4155 RepID=UPI00064E14FA|nr:PREDICTED: isoflavone 2'-hydroxylase-like [Erythranthe guttata]|eukprot:XP_012839373.1 PREDICTED: isoflavone 2'-hydroxylase-like [Erythranthe guttata]
MYLYLAWFTLVVFFIKWYSLRRRQNSAPPAPPSLPFIGHVHLLKEESLHLSLSSLSRRYGSVFSLRLGCRPFLVVSSPSAVEECFTTNDVVFANRPDTLAADCVTYGRAAYVWSPYGQHWRTLRRVSAAEIFSSQSLLRTAGTRENEIRALLRVLHGGKKKSTAAATVDLTYLVSTFVFNNMMRVVSGRQLVSEEDIIGGDAGREAVKQIRGVFPPTLTLVSCDFFPVLRWIGYGGVERRLRLIHGRRDVFLQRLVDEFKGSKGTRSTTCLIETLLSLQATDPVFYTDDVIKSVLMVMFVAGTETSVTAMERAMSLILSHPEKLQKLSDEIDENVGHDRLLADSDLAKLPYLRCIINETLRLYPPTPTVLPHVSSEDCTVGGHSIPKGTILLVNVWAMHRDPEQWDRPEEFVPERFQFESERELGHKFLPFGMGRRGCPGSGMALRTVSLGLAALVQCFDWETLSGDVAAAKPLEAVCFAREQAAHIFEQL